MYFFYFFVRRSIDVLDKKKPSLDPDSIGTDPDPGLTEDVGHQKYEHKKEGWQNYLRNLFNSILNIFYRSGYRALDQKFGQNRYATLALLEYLCRIRIRNTDGKTRRPWRIINPIKICQKNVFCHFFRLGL